MHEDILAKYVATRVSAGISKETIKEELLSVGWSEEAAGSAYRDGLVTLGIPVPDEGTGGLSTKKSSAADIVVNAFSFILLGIVVTAIGALFFAIIEKQFPDALDAMNMAYGNASNTSAIHYALAAIIVAFPLYVLSVRIWFRRFRDDEGRVESRLSKWLTYLVLLIAAVTIVGDLITLIFTLLQGEVTARFFLKAITILSLAGAVFGFYYLERRKIQYGKAISRAVFQRFGWTVAAIVGAGIVLGFFVGDSPEVARGRSFDAQRSDNLSALASCVQNYASDFGQLPVSFDELTHSSAYAYCASFMRDPETKQLYGYHIVIPSKSQGPALVGTFELCATFALASDPNQAGGTGVYDDKTIWYAHGIGNVCIPATAQLVVRVPVDGVSPPSPVR